MARIDWKQEAQGREKIYFILLPLLLLFMFGRIVWGPRLSKTADLQKSLQAEQGIVTAYKKQLEELKKQQAQAGSQVAAPATVSATDERFAAYSRGEMKSRQEVLGEVIRAITGPQVVKDGIELLSHKSGTEIDANTYLMIPLEIDLEGPFGALLRYLDRVEDLPLLLTIDNVELNAPPEKGGRVQAKLFSTVYVVKSAAAITQGGSLPTATTPARGGK